MMNFTKDRIEEIKSNGYQLDFGSVFNHAVENYKKIALYAGLVLFVFFIFFGILTAVLLVGIFGAESITQNMKPENFRPENFTTDFLLIYSVSIVVFSCLLSPFQAGFLKMADHGEKGHPFHVSTLFEYYKAPYLKEILTATFFISSITMAQSILFTKIGYEIIGSLIAYCISFISLFTIPLVVFGKLKAFEAIKSSIIIVLKQPFILLGLLIVAYIAACIGLFACCIGLFFTIPFIYSMNYAIYSYIVGIDTDTEIQDFDTSTERDF